MDTSSKQLTIPGTAGLPRPEGAMVAVRWVAAVVALVQIVGYDAMPYPAGARGAALAVLAALVVGNLAIIVLGRRAQPPRWLGTGAFVLDFAITSGLAWVYAFDGTTSVWLVYYVLPIEGALRWSLRGSVVAWALAVTSYIARELYAAAVFGLPVLPTSIGLRMGVLLVLTVAIGLMARDLRQRTDELTDTVGHLREVEAWREGLTSALAHDIRSPLSAAVSSLKLIEDRWDEVPLERLVPLVAGSRRSVLQVLHLADDILTMARADEGRLVIRREETDVRRLVARVLDTVAPEERVALEPSTPVTANIDPSRVEQIVANLVSNAVKHGEPPVAVSVAPGPAAGAVIAVRDRGPGVPPPLQERLFDRFASGARADSVGLGLWVVHLLTDAHGGTVRYEADGGSTFVVELPGDVADPSAQLP